MSRTQEEQILLDEKIARIRKKNEEILRRKQLIDEEIEYAKAQNAFVNSKSCSESEIDFGPTLYADSIKESNRSQGATNVEYPAYKKALPSKERSRNKIDDTEWRAERNRIDEERIRRQRGNSGWRREWDADKVIDEFELTSTRTDFRERKSNDRNINYNYERKSFKESPRNSKQNNAERNHNLSFSNKTNKFETQCSAQDYNQTKTQSISSGRPRIRNNVKKDNFNDCSWDTKENLVFERNRTLNPNHFHNDDKSPSNSDERKSKLIKKVSWANDDDSVNKNNICLTDNLKNIVVCVRNSENVSNKRSVEITNERKPSVAAESFGNQFTDLESEQIKTFVAKSGNSNFLPVRLDYDEKTTTTKLKVNSSNIQDFSSTVITKPAVSNKIRHVNSPPKDLVLAAKPMVSKKGNLKNSLTEKNTKVTHTCNEHKKVLENVMKKGITESELSQQGKINSNDVLKKEKEKAVNVDYSNDEEWVDASDDEWEDISDEE